jgi:hypothetical protein
MPSRTFLPLVPVLAALVLAAPPAAAQEDDRLVFGGDAWLAGDTVAAAEATEGDLFIAGATVSAAAPVGGAAHMAGRRVTLSAPVEGNLYAAGQTVTSAGTVAGNASLAGFAVMVEAEVSGNLRAAGNTVTLAAPVGGSALIGAETVDLEAAIAGDLRVAAEDIGFGPGAAIGGTLTLYSDSLTAADIPDSAIPADRVTVEPARQWDGPFDDGMAREMGRRAIWGGLAAFLWGVLTVTVAAALLAALAPRGLAAMRARILGRPWASLGFGFLAMSAAIGSGILLAITGIGLLLAPAGLALTLALWFAGYVIGAYAVGAGLWIAIRSDAPDTVLERALAGGLGAVTVGLIALIPFLGWLFAILVMLAGAGALAIGLFRPAFGADSGA